jgi:hypothetical protein
VIPVVDHEARARWEVQQRSGRVDEITGQGTALHWSHRIAAGRGGTYRPANGLDLSPAVHEWLHRNPALAYAGGWHVESGATVQDVPVWLARPWPGWFLIEDRVTDGPHLLLHCDEQPARPRLPFESEDAYRADLDRLLAIA